MTWWLLIPLILGAPLTLVLHEASHALATWATGGRVDAFRPWPHRWGGRWWFGRMMRTGGNDHLVAWAPHFKASAMLVVYGLVGMLTAWHVWTLFAWEWVDLLWWWRGWLLRKPSSDGGKARGC